MKKLNQKGFTHHLVMFVILAVVLGAMGFAGYRVWQNKNIDARAANWGSSIVYNFNNTVNAHACRVRVTNSTSLVRTAINNTSAQLVYGLSSRIGNIPSAKPKTWAYGQTSGAISNRTKVTYTLQGIGFGPSTHKATKSVGALTLC